MTVSVTGCKNSSVKQNDLKFDLIEPADSDYNCMSDKLVDQLLKHNCKLEPKNEYCL